MSGKPQSETFAEFAHRLITKVRMGENEPNQNEIVADSIIKHRFSFGLRGGGPFNKIQNRKDVIKIVNEVLKKLNE